MELDKRSPHLFLAVGALHVYFCALVIQMLSQIFNANWVLQFALFERAAAFHHLSINTVGNNMT